MAFSHFHGVAVNNSGLFIVKKLLYHFLERSVQRTACGPPSPRSRLVKNKTDAKLETTSLSAGVFQ